MHNYIDPSNQSETDVLERHSPARNFVLSALLHGDFSRFDK